MAKSMTLQAAHKNDGQRGAPVKIILAFALTCALLGLYAIASTGDPVRQAGATSTCKTNLREQLSALRVPGLAVAIVKDGELVCTGTAGMANTEDSMQVQPDTVFLTASVSKTVTVTALMQLYDDGAFDLDDDINDYLPFDVRVPSAPDEPITFRQILTHTASIKDDDTLFGVTPVDISSSTVSLSDFTTDYLTPYGMYYDRRANFEQTPPGTTYQYSNMGIVLAGYLVEAISGIPFDRFTQERIFKPLGMKQSFWRLAEVSLSRLAMPYERERGRLFRAYGHYEEPNYPDGMLRSTITDLAKFVIVYMQRGEYGGKRILEAETVDEIVKPQTSLDDSQGLVWFSDEIKGRTVWGHNGSDIGASAAIWLDRERDTGVVVLSNGRWRDDGDLLARLFREADSY
jgi:CubicO group peptidase (beta-lactamase class C family)